MGKFDFAYCQNPGLMAKLDMLKAIRFGTVFAAPLIALSLAAPARADLMAWSQHPPGGLDPAKTPMFVCFGFDDNARVEGVNWFADLVRNKKNPAGTGNPQTFDGSPVRATFFITANYTEDGFIAAGTQTVPDLVQAWKGLYQDGHEIGNHTWDHPHGSGLDVDAWKSQIQKSNDHLAKILGIPVSAIKGFRTPYLEYGPNTLQAVKDMGFLYDVSIEFGYNGWQPLPGDSGNWNSMTNPETHKKLFWPHTLDEGSPPGNASKGNPKQPGLWEIPVNSFILADNSADVTGLDFNLWKVSDKDKYVATLKHNLDLRRAGNRAPLAVGAHSDYYSQYNPDANKEFTLADYKQRQAAMEEFLAYALSFPDVRVVRYEDILTWMKNPVALGNDPNAGISSATLRTAALSVRLAAPDRLELSIPVPGRYTLSVATPRGKVLATATRHLEKGLARIDLPRALPHGVYFIRMGDGTRAVRHRVTLLP
jgi:hypothetical protein